MHKKLQFDEIRNLHCDAMGRPSVLKLPPVLTEPIKAHPTKSTHTKVCCEMAETASTKTSLPTIPHQTVSLQTARESSASVYPAKMKQLARWALSGKPDACPFVPSSMQFKDERVDPRADAMDGFLSSGCAS